MQLDEQLMADFPQLDYIDDPLMPPVMKGLIEGKTIYLNPNQTYIERPCTIAEEIGHYLTTVGDITAQDTLEKRKQERKARDVGAAMLVTPFSIIDCYENGCNSVLQCADFLQITVQTFTDAVKWYARKWDGIWTSNGYCIFFMASGSVRVRRFSFT